MKEFEEGMTKGMIIAYQSMIGYIKDGSTAGQSKEFAMKRIHALETQLKAKLEKA